MLRDLTKYLGAMLPATHERGIAFDRDLDLALAYLNVQRIRMGPRLAFEVDVPSEARQALVPPMLTTTLVENSIKHGLSPKVGALLVLIPRPVVGAVFLVICGMIAATGLRLLACGPRDDVFHLTTAISLGAALTLPLAALLRRRVPEDATAPRVTPDPPRATTS